MIDDSPNLARVCSLLVVAIDELRAIRSDLAGRKAAKNPRALSDSDRIVLSALLPAVALMFGEAEFTVGLLMHQLEKSGASVAKRAKRAIAGMNALKLGSLFKRAVEAGVPIGGLYVHVIRPSRMGNVMICGGANAVESRLGTIFANQMRGTITP